MIKKNLKIVIFGKNGQVGRRLRTSLLPLGQVIAFDSKAVNLLDSIELATVLRKERPDVIVNAAAYTAVDKAESDQKTAFAVNATAAGVMADEAAGLNALLVHYSTDYVFDGTKQGLYMEDDPICPISAYGASKAEGDMLVSKSGCKHLILRVSWVYDAYGKNFPRTILGLAAKNENLRVVADQVGAPNSAAFIAATTALVLHRTLERNDQALSGVYNLSCTGQTSWHGITLELIERATAMGIQLKCPVQALTPISTHEYPLPAARPINSGLSTTKLCETFGLHMPAWQDYLPIFLEELAALEKLI